MKRALFTGEALGEFWVPGQGHKIGGQLTLVHGQSPVLAVTGSFEEPSKRDPFGLKGVTRFPVVYGQILIPGKTNAFKSITLVSVSNLNRTTGLRSGIEVAVWNACFALLGNELLDLEQDRFNTVDVCLEGFPEAYGPSPKEIQSIEPTQGWPVDIFGRAAAAQLGVYVWIGRKQLSREETLWWEALFRLTLDNPESLNQCLQRIPALISGYSMLNGRYTPVHWLRLANHQPGSVTSDYDLYGRFGQDWTTVAKYHMDQNAVNEPEDREFLLRWLDFYRQDSGQSVAKELFGALHARYLASQQQKIDWRRELIRLGALTEAIFKLRPGSESVWPREKEFEGVWKRIEPLINQTIEQEALQLPIDQDEFVTQLKRTWRIISRDSLAEHLRAIARDVEDNANIAAGQGTDAEIKQWVRMRHQVAHHGTDLPSDRESFIASQEWRAILNAWLLMHLGAHPETIVSLGKKWNQRS